MAMQLKKLNEKRQVYYQLIKERKKRNMNLDMKQLRMNRYMIDLKRGQFLLYGLEFGSGNWADE